MAFKEKIFVCLWLCFFCMVGVFAADEVKSVMEGESVTLSITVSEIKNINRIMWKFGQNKSLIAKISREFSKFTLYDDETDGRFRDRLQLDNQTGSLIITNINNNDTGDYEVTIISSKTTTYTFRVTVYASTTPDSHTPSQPTSNPTSGPPSGSSSRPPSGSSSRPPSGSPSHPSGSSSDSSLDPLILPISASAGFLLLVASVGIFCICRKIRKTNQQAETREEEITYADPTFYKNVQKPSAKQEDDVVYARVVTRR